MKFYLINPILYLQTKSSLFGYFKFDVCECGCTDFKGWGFNFGLFGLNKGVIS